VFQSEAMPRFFVLGMAERLADLVDPKNDPVGLQLEEENLPQRIAGAEEKPEKRKSDGTGKPLCTWTWTALPT